MIDHPDDQDLQKLIAGDRAGSLEADEAAEVALLAELLGDPSTWAEPSSGLEDSIVRAIAASPAGAEPAPASRQARRRRAPSMRLRVAASAAAAAVVAVAAIVATQGGGTSADFTAELAATSVLPDAHASAVISRNEGGFRISLAATGLPPRPKGEFYEAWLKDGKGTLVPIGTFSSSDDDVTLWSGVSPADYPRISVTIEPDDNNQASSGRVVLAGAVRASP